MTTLIGSSLIKLLTQSSTSNFRASSACLTWSTIRSYAIHRPITEDDFVRVYGPDGKIIGVKTREEAESMARKRGMKLVSKQMVSKPKFPEFQLECIHQLVSETDPKLELKRMKKSDFDALPVKILTFGTTISDKDLEVKCVQINKWLKKLNKVNVIIVGTPKEQVSLDLLLEKMQNQFIPEAIISNKEELSLSLKFTVYPDLNNEQFIESRDGRDAVEPEIDFKIDPELLNKDDVQIDKIVRKPDPNLKKGGGL